MLFRFVIALPLVFTLCLPSSLQAQQLDVRFEHITVEQGLSSNSVQAICQDHQGFLWVATPDGLNRYDGYQFTTYRNIPLDTTSLSHNWISTIYVAPTEPDVLWVGTREGGLDRFDREKGLFTHFPHDVDDGTSLSSNHVTALYEDRSGVLWIGTDNGGLNRMDRATGTFTQYQHEPGRATSLSNNDVNTLYEDSAGDFWVGTNDGLNRMDRATGTFTRYYHEAADPTSLSRDPITVLYEDRSGVLWVGTGGGLNRMDRATGTFTRYQHEPGRATSLSNNIIHALYEDGAGDFWVGTFDGLNRLDRTTGTFIRHYHDENDPTSISNDIITALYEDRSGLLWVGTEDKGLNTFYRVRSRFLQYRHEPDNPHSLGANHVIALLEDHSGALWVGTEDMGLSRIDPSSGLFTHYRHDPTDPTSLKGDRVSILYEDRSEMLWVVSYNRGVSKLDQATGTFVHYDHEQGNPASLSHDIVRALYEDRAGQFWVGTKNGLDRLDRATGTFTHYRHEAGNAQSLGHNSIRVIYEAPTEPGILWVGTDGGLERFDLATETFTHYRHDPTDATSLSYNSIRPLYEDRAGNFWVGTRGGLNKMDRETGRFAWFNEAKGLPSEVIVGIAEDDGGTLWIGTTKGLSKFDPESETFRNYDIEDGLLNREFERQAFVKRMNGQIFLGGLQGINAFHPDSLQENRHVPPVALTDFTLFGQSVPFETELSAVREIELTYWDNHFAFEFAALDFVRPQKNRYAYYLEGFEDDWIDNGTRRIVSYTNLDPGTYTFHVKGTNNDGVWNEEGTSVRVIITPPYWKTWWFQTLMGLLIVGVLWSAYQLRVRNITAHNQALQKEIAERKRVETEREQLITALEHQADTLEDKNHELEDKNAELERFAYTVSHDLKSPLVTIKGFLGLLRHDVAQGDLERVGQDVQHIDNAANKMTHLLDELLDLSRVGRLVNPPERIALTELANEAAALVKGQIEARGVTVEIAPAMPSVYGDRVRLGEVFQNLIDNAVKFMGDQASPKVQVGASLKDKKVCCFVRDNGKGIDPVYQDQVFGLFDRLDADEEGTGIGLALVKRIVEVHGGRIWIASEGEGQGSTFWFTLPVGSSTALDE